MDDFTSEKYKTNIKNIDDEHLVLFLLMREIDGKSRSGNHNFLFNLLDELSEKIKTHYRFEEQFMHEIGFPGLEAHKLAHNKIIDALHHVIDASKQAPNFIWLSKTIEMMQLHHIEKHDLEIAKFVNSKI